MMGFLSVGAVMVGRTLERDWPKAACQTIGIARNWLVNEACTAISF